MKHRLARSRDEAIRLAEYCIKSCGECYHRWMVDMLRNMDKWEPQGRYLTRGKVWRQTAIMGAVLQQLLARTICFVWLAKLRKGTGRQMMAEVNVRMIE